MSVTDPAPPTAASGGSAPVLGDRIDSDTEITLLDFERPTLLSGVYSLTARPGMKVDNVERLGPAAARTWSFAVRGPRYALPPGAVVSCFPAPRAQGPYKKVLPHVSLARTTLPWERSGGPADTAEGPPWLALISFDPDIAAEGPRQQIRVEARLVDAEVRAALNHAAEPGEAPATVRLLRMAPNLARDLLPPDARAARLGCHVRSVAPSGGAPVRRSVVLAARPLSGAGRRVLHLVSIEGLYGTDGALHLPTTGVALVSLHSWEVTVQSQPHGDFSAVLGRVRAAPLGTTRAGLDGFPQEAAFMAAGAAPLRHRLRDGGRTVSWYHGPLSGALDTMPQPDLSFPARTADDLLVVDADRGMIDASYAAAWELGRLTVLSRPRLARSLAAWKRNHRRYVHACNCPDMKGMCHGATIPREPAFPAVSFFASDLGTLRGVPFGYLVPDPAMLPAERLRFFDLDPLWIKAFKDGAFSLGRATEADYATDCDHCACHDCITHCHTASGVLLRSVAVSDWPDLLIDGYDKGGAALDVLRAERLGPHVLLAMFGGKVASVLFHLHPQAFHFELKDKSGAALTNLAAGGEGAAEFAYRHRATAPGVSFTRQQK